MRYPLYTFCRIRQAQNGARRLMRSQTGGADPFDRSCAELVSSITAASLAVPASIPPPMSGLPECGPMDRAPLTPVDI
jgi:hypothetical protein